MDLSLDYLPRLPRRKDMGIGCIGAGFIMRDCHLVAYRQAGFNPVAIASTLGLGHVKVPIVAFSLWVAYRVLAPFLAERHVPKLVIIVSMAGAKPYFMAMIL